MYELFFFHFKLFLYVMKLVSQFSFCANHKSILEVYVKVGIIATLADIHISGPTSLSLLSTCTCISLVCETLLTSIYVCHVRLSLD